MWGPGGPFQFLEGAFLGVPPSLQKFLPAPMAGEGGVFKLRYWQTKEHSKTFRGIVSLSSVS